MILLCNTYFHIAFEIKLFQYLSQFLYAPFNYFLPSVYPGLSLYTEKLYVTPRSRDLGSRNLSTSSTSR